MKALFFSLASCLLLITSCKQENTPKEPTQVIERPINDSNAEMVAELKAIAQNKENINTWHLNKDRAQAIDQKAEVSADFGAKISLLFKSGIEWLNAGDYTKAIDRFRNIEDIIKQNKLRIPPAAMYGIREMLGMAYLRKAEIENCLHNHNEYSCILPIADEGQHSQREGSEAALRIFSSIMNTPDAKMTTKWLYNIAHMTLGSYPEGVPDKYLIDPSVFESEKNIPRFTDIAMSVGVAVDDISGSVVMEDFNNDGYLDLLVSSYGLDDQLRYFENNRKGSFDDKTKSAGLTGLWSGLNMVQADYNNDGWIDVFVLRGAWLGADGRHPNSLLQNNGNGTFTDVTKQSGLYSLFPTQTASWADYNNDGWIDLFIGNEHSPSISAPTQLFHNNGDGTFVDVAAEKGLKVNAFIKGCVWGDYDNDGDMDLYVSVISGDNMLFNNGGAEQSYTFTDVAAASGTTEPKVSFPCWFFDFNQDGWEDIFVSGFDFRQFETAGGEVAKDYLGMQVAAELPRLYQNNQDGTFSEVSNQKHVDKVLYTMGCNFGDLNNDGYPDFYAATGTPDFRAIIPNRMFLNDAGRQFLDVTTAGGFGHLQKGHGVAFGDLDNDGDQDVYNVLGGSYDGDNFMNALFLNPGFNNNWLKLKLIGTTSNRSAIGARVNISVSNNSGDKKTLYHRINSGASFGANTLKVEQGLGQYDVIDKIEIFWPGSVESHIISGAKVNGHYTITQGDNQLKKVDATQLKLSQGAHHHH
jgi:hypothetical protein